MNKQEVISEIEKIDYQNLEYDSPERMLSAQKQLIIDIIEQLDESQKVKVPAFVAEYIEAHRKWGPEIFINNWLDDYDNVDIWLYNNSEKENNRRFLIAAKAFVEGYEVEEEPLYTVTFNLDLNYHLALDEGDGYDEISTTLTTGRGVLGYRYFLTEKEIKSIDERYWPFAVPVDGTVEEV